MTRYGEWPSNDQGRIVSNCLEAKVALASFLDILFTCHAISLAHVGEEDCMTSPKEAKEECERRRAFHCRLYPPRQATVRNTSAFVGPRLILETAGAFNNILNYLNEILP